MEETVKQELWLEWIIMIEIGKRIGYKEIVRIAEGEEMKLSEGAKEKMRKSRKIVEDYYKEGRALYGVTTGIGELANVLLSKEEARIFPEKLILSHSGGAGKILSKEVIRAAIASRLSSISKGYSGVRVEVVEFIIEMMNRGITPVMYEASVGASGDLAPFAQAMLVPLGRGKAFYKGKLMDGNEALKKAGLEPIEYELKDGLAVINGSSLITGIACLVVDKGINIIENAEIAGAISFEALNAVMRAFEKEIFETRGFRGAIISAEKIRKLMRGSELYTNPRRVQDAYSIRSTPQVIGAVRDAIGYLKEQVEMELNGAADNPLFIDKKGEKYFTGANFQGTPIALPLEMVKVGLVNISVLSERRLNRLINENLNDGLPGFLVGRAGLNSGIMIPQYTAAYFVNKNRVLAYPASVGSIPTAADQEDFVSMGTNTAINALEIVENTEYVIAIEMLAGRQALELRLRKEKRKIGKGVKKAFEFLSKEIEFIEEDRVLSDDIEKLKKIVEKGEIKNKVN